MSTNNERCLNPWVGFLIILVVCIVILVAIFNEFKGGTHHSRLHANQNAMTQAAFLSPNADASTQPNEITF